MLRLIHLSDIHFTSPECLNPRTDMDSTDRDLLVDDLLNVVIDSGVAIDAILVTGDITFKASKDEFNCATAWFKEISDKFSIDVTNIFVVPGNHDVNRSVANKRVIKAHRNDLLS